jgi:3-hydroxyisobutyrate dehydrogenase-like beta-hydroxyacid dehydrogenase
MKVGVLGSGTVGQVFAAGLLEHGHRVMMGTRDPRNSGVQGWPQKPPVRALERSQKPRASANWSCWP